MVVSVCFPSSPAWPTATLQSLRAVLRGPARGCLARVRAQQPYPQPGTLAALPCMAELCMQVPAGGCAEEASE